MADFCVFWYSETRLILLDVPVLFWEYFSGNFLPCISRTSVLIMRVSEHWTCVSIACRVYTTIEDLRSDYTEGLLHPGDLKPALAKALNKILQVKYSHILAGLWKTIASFSNSFQWWQTILLFEWVLIAARARSFQEQCCSKGLIGDSQGILTSVSFPCWNYMCWSVIFGFIYWLAASRDGFLVGDDLRSFEVQDGDMMQSKYVFCGFWLLIKVRQFLKLKRDLKKRVSWWNWNRELLFVVNEFMFLAFVNRDTKSQGKD